MRNEKQMGGQLTERALPYLSAARCCFWGVVGVEREMRDDHFAVSSLQTPRESWKRVDHRQTLAILM